MLNDLAILLSQNISLGDNFYAAELILTGVATLFATLYLTKNLRIFFKGTKKKYLLLLGVVVVLAAIIRIDSSHWRLYNPMYELEYLDNARNIARHHTFAECVSGSPESCSVFSRPYHLPAYPFLLSIPYLFSDEYIPIGQIVNLLFSILGIVAIFILSKQLFGDETGLISAALLAAWPIHILYSTLVSGENVAVFLQLLVLIALCTYLQKNSLENTVFYLSSLALFLLSRPEAIFFVPFGIIVLAFHFLRRKKYCSLLLIAALTGAVSIAPLLHSASLVWGAGYASVRPDLVLFYFNCLFYISIVFSALFFLGCAVLLFKNRTFLLSAILFQVITSLPFLVVSVRHIKYSLHMMIAPLIIGAYGTAQMIDFLKAERRKHFSFFAISVSALILLSIIATSADVSRLRSSDTISIWTEDYAHVFSNLTAHFDHSYTVLADITMGHMFAFYNYSFTGYDKDRIMELINQGQKVVLFDDIYIRGRNYNISNYFTYGRSYCGSEPYNWNWCLRELRTK
jgi:hypothetical protein